MTRTHRSARTQGTRRETQLATYLRTQLNDDRIDRQARTGAKDRGDIRGVHIWNQPLAVEVKNTTRIALPQWMNEARTEAGNIDALAGLIIHKRHGTAAPGEQWVTTCVDELLSLLTGDRYWQL